MTEITVTAAAEKYGVPEPTLRAFCERGCSEGQRLSDPLSGVRDGTLYVQDDARLARVVARIIAGRQAQS